MRQIFYMLITLTLFIPSIGCGKKVGAQAGKAETPVEKVYEYGVGPDDVLQIDVWRHPELSREVTVRPDGVISLPLISDVKVTGMVAKDLAQVLKLKFREYVEDPEVTVTVKASNSYKVYILGKVNNSGVFVSKIPITVVQAIAMAGGFTPYASTGNIVVLRRQGKTEKRMRVDYDDVVRGNRSEQNFVLQPGDTVVIP